MGLVAGKIVAVNGGPGHDDGGVAALAVLAEAPRAVTRRVCARIEDERNLPRGGILGKVRTYLVSEARHDAIAEVYTTFLKRGKRLTLHQLGDLFELNFKAVDYALKKRGVKE